MSKSDNSESYIRKFHKKVWESKLKARPEISKQESDWWAMNFHQTFDLSYHDIKENIIRISREEVSQKEFREKYENNYIPVVVLDDQKTWIAKKKWTLERLKKKYRNQRFRAGEDDDGYGVKIKMKYFIDYMKKNKDDSPLYIFDGSFGENKKKARLLEDYEISDYFKEDLFKYCGENRRPPYRWFVMGPARSGTGIHIDPLGTSAWNALVRGHKRWCLFPPDTPREILKPVTGEGWKNRSEAIVWFTTVYPRMATAEMREKYKMVEVIQRPGETMFVPGGWWHVVLNLDDSVAVTQNFCSSSNFRIVWYKTVRSRYRLSRKWYRKLKYYRPDLAKIADEIDTNSRMAGVPSSSSSSSSSSSDSESSASSSEETGDSGLVRTKKRVRARGRSDESEHKFDSKRERRMDH